MVHLLNLVTRQAQLKLPEYRTEGFIAMATKIQIDELIKFLSYACKIIQSFFYPLKVQHVLL